MAWNGKNRRKENREFNGEEKRARVGHNFRESAQLYQMDMGVRVLFLPEFNVWQVHKMDYPSYQKLRWEITGYNNNHIAFEFAVLYIKLLKYGLDEDEMAKLGILGYEPMKKELKPKYPDGEDSFNDE